MTKITITVDENEIARLVTERIAVAMALEPLGKVRIVSVDDGTGKK